MGSDDDLRRRLRDGLRERESDVAALRTDRLRRLADRRGVPGGRAIGGLIAVLLFVGAGVWLLSRSDETPDVAVSGGGGLSDGAAPADVESSSESTVGPLPQCSVLGDPPPIVDGPLSQDTEVAEQQAARASFGFPSDEATVAALLDGPQPELPADLEAVGQDMSEGLGLVLTADEVQDMYDRQLGPIRGASGEAIRAFAEAHPETYQGRWIDQAAGGVFRVAVTGDVDAQWAELEPTLPDGHRVEMQAARYSRVELDEFSVQVEAVLVDLGLRGSVGVGESIGLVSVHLSSDAGLDTDALAAALDGLPVCVADEESAPVDAEQAAVDPGWVAAGLNLGISDIFFEVRDAAHLRDLSDLTVLATFSGYEYNPGYEPGMESSADPGLYVAGYAGPGGLLRLRFVVTEVLGGIGSDGIVAGQEIQVDTEYWIMDLEDRGFHFSQLDRLASASVPYLLVLNAGKLFGESTGAYVLWPVPMGWMTVTDEGTLDYVATPTYDLVAGEALRRGELIEPDPTHADGDPDHEHPHEEESKEWERGGILAPWSA